MKIVENTDRRLVIVHRPWIIAGMIWGMGLAALYGAVTGKQIHSTAEHLLVAALGIGMSFAAWYWFAFLRITFDRDTGRSSPSSCRMKTSSRRLLARWPVVIFI